MAGDQGKEVYLGVRTFLVSMVAPVLSVIASRQQAQDWIDPVKEKKNLKAGS